MVDEKKLPVAAVLAVIITVGFMALLFYVVGRVTLSAEVVAMLIGALVTGFAGVTGYYFGSSAGSRVKTEMIEKMQSGVAQGSVSSPAAVTQIAQTPGKVGP